MKTKKYRIYILENANTKTESKILRKIPDKKNKPN